MAPPLSHAFLTELNGPPNQSFHLSNDTGTVSPCQGYCERTGLPRWVYSRCPEGTRHSCGPQGLMLFLLP